MVELLVAWVVETAVVAVAAAVVEGEASVERRVWMVAAVQAEVEEVS